jgi:hypothetical protein
MTPYVFITLCGVTSQESASIYSSKYAVSYSIDTKLHGLTSQKTVSKQNKWRHIQQNNSYVANKLHGVKHQKTATSYILNQNASYPRSQQVPICQITLRHIPEIVIYQTTQCYIPEDSKYQSTELQGVYPRKQKVPIHQITRSTTQKTVSTNLPNYKEYISENRRYLSTKLQGVQPRRQTVTTY